MSASQYQQLAERCSLPLHLGGPSTKCASEMCEQFRPATGPAGPQWDHARIEDILRILEQSLVQRPAVDASYPVASCLLGAIFHLLVANKLVSPPYDHVLNAAQYLLPTAPSVIRRVANWGAPTSASTEPHAWWQRPHIPDGARIIDVTDEEEPYHATNMQRAREPIDVRPLSSRGERMGARRTERVPQPSQPPMGPWIQHGDGRYSLGHKFA
ncbi:MAG: hypothetical protein Q9170_003149 [Blastenia crenularia]